MPEDNDTQGKQDQQSQDIEKPSYVGWWVIVLFGFSLLAALVIVSLVLRQRGCVPEWVGFLTTNALSLFLLFAVVIQAYIYFQQRKLMQGQLDVMGIAVAPRLRIADVTVEDFKVGKTPVFIVSIMNDGATDARSVLLNIQVGMKEEGLEKKWSNPQVVTIPARQTQHYFVPWTRALTGELVHAINTRSTSIKVSGYFKLGDRPQADFCYMYYPWRGIRPDRISQFIPCDFDPALKTLVGLQAFVKPTASLTLKVIRHENKEHENPN
jgi:hypothetical protein